MTHADLRQRFYAKLSEHYLQGELQSLYHWCVAEIHGWSRVGAYAKNDLHATEEAISTWKSVIARLQQHEPVQYIFNKAHFRDLELYVDPAVLIPRPETEELVEWVLESETADDLDVLDIGTGSGCIALSIKKERTNWQVSGCDVSKEALTVAQRNAENLTLEIQWFECDVRSATLPQVDVVVSNPPYIPKEVEATLEDNVLKHEPHLALFSPENDPFYFIKRITQLASDAGVKRVYFETHATDMSELMSELALIWVENIESKKDLSGKERFLKLSR